MSDNVIEVNSRDGKQSFRCSIELSQDMKDVYGIDISRFVEHFLEYASKYNDNKNTWTFEMKHDFPDSENNMNECTISFKFKKRD